METHNMLTACYVLILVTKPNQKKNRAAKGNAADKNNPPKQVTAEPKWSTQSAIRDLTSGKVPLEKWVENLITAEHPTVLPRLIPSEVAPKNHTAELDVTIPANSYGSIIVSPNYVGMVELWVPKDITGGQISPADAHVTSSQHTNMSTTNFIVPEIPLRVVDEAGHTIQTASSPFAGYRTLTTEGKFVDSRVTYYPGTFTFNVGGDSWAGFSVYNPDQAAMTNCIMDICSYDPAGNAIMVVMTQTLASIGGHTSLNFNNFQLPGGGDPAPSQIVDNLVIRFSITNKSTIGDLPVGLGFGYVQSADDTITYSGGGTWNTYGLFNLLTNQSTALVNQITDSSAISYTAMSCLVQNVSAELTAAGSIVACQMPGGSYGRLPGNPVQLYSFVATQIRGQRYHGKLKDGCYWSYVPDKLEDLFFDFEQVEAYEARNNIKSRPYLVVAFKGGEAPQQMKFVFNMLTELMTNDISVTSMIGPVDIKSLIATYLYFAQRQNRICCNPDHVTHIFKLVKDIVNNPQFRKTALKLLKTAGGAALTLL
jgi:hypothetical protein